MRRCCTLLLLILLSGLRVMAHEVRPAFLELTETEPGRFEALWKVPAKGGAPLAGDDIPHQPDPEIPADTGLPQSMPCGCPAPTAADLQMGVLPIHPTLPKHVRMAGPPRVERLTGAVIKRWAANTGAEGLHGHEIRIHGLEATMIDVLVRITFADGRVVSRLLRPDSPSFTVDAGSDSPAKEYLVLGVEHILLGIDHLLFVLALILIVRGTGLLVKTITAFTIAHSITLGLATLGYVNVPSAPVEAIIALSIVFVAREVAVRREGSPSLTERKPWLVAFSFGLLHGFGFAGALSDVGLPPNAIPSALLFFNIGVELGQLLFVAAVLTILHQSRRVGRVFSVALPSWTRRIAPYAIGGLAAFWVIERVTAF